MPYKRPDSEYWWITWVDASGQRQRQSAGTKVKRDAEAIEKRRQLETFEQKKFGVEPDRTFEDLMLLYIGHADLKDTQRVSYATKALLRYFAGAVLNTLSRKDITEFIEQRKAANGTIRRELGLFRAAINWAIRDLEWAIPNPVYLPTKPKPKLRWLTKAEYQILLKAAERSYNKQLPDLIRLAVNTGMRKSEMQNLRWDQVDMDTRMIYFAPEEVKSGRHESIPLNKTAYEVLERLSGEGKRVFTYRGGGSFRKAFEGAVERSGLEGVTIHTLRHTFASWLVQAGVPLKVIQELMRHGSIESTMIYTHTAPDNVRHGIEALET